MDVLDIPTHPYLVTPPAESSLEQRPDGTGDPDLESRAESDRALEMAAPDSTREEPRQGLTSPELAQQVPQVSGAEMQTSDEPSDAGAPDGASPTDAAATLPGCAASQSLGPNGQCFATLATLLTWSAARQSCRDLGTGWDLASIRGEDVDQFVARLLDGESWIGGADLANEGTWRWVSDGTVFWRGLADAGSPVNNAYTHWSGSEPNDNRNSDCARIVPEQAATWADLECDERRAAVCEGPAR